MELQMALMAFAEGKPKNALELLAQLIDGYAKRGMTERANRMRGGTPRLEAELGMTDAARKLLRELPPLDGSTDVPVAFAEVGEDARAETILQRDLKQFPQDTLWQYVRGPEIAAAIALSRNKPEAAIEALRRSIPYDLRSSELPSLRGRAFLAARQPSQAIAEFRKVLDHPTVEPLSANHTLAHLGLARALALAGDILASRAEYQEFFALWKEADADLPVLRLAHNEYTGLPAIGAVK
jgi:predicted Zn-dependent protease